MQERRRGTPPIDLDSYLHQLPALLLMDRLPTPILGVGPHGNVVYANPAFAGMLGYVDGATVARLHLRDLMAGTPCCSDGSCVTMLRNATTFVGWRHAQNYVVRTTVSPPLLVRDSDPLLLVGVTDVTEWLWESKPPPTLPERNGDSP